jgi:hypothetical protein
MPPTATTSQQALQQLQTTQGSQKTADQVYGEANQSLGVDKATEQVQGLRGAITRTTGLLNQVAPSVYGRTQGSLVTNAQATRQIGNEQAPIQQNLQDLGTQYSSASSDLGNLRDQANTRASATLAQQQGNLSYLQQLYQQLQGKEQNDAQLAEQQRQFNMTPHGSSGGSSYASPTFGGANTSSYKVARDAGGGLAFTNGSKPITAAQYINATGGSFNDLLGYLAQSKNPGDAQILKDASTMSQVQLVKKYPYVFGSL